MSASGLIGSVSKTKNRGQTPISVSQTPISVSQLLAAGYRELSPAESVRISAEMFELDRLLFEASLPAGLDERTKRKLIVEHYYGPALAERVFPELPK